MEKQFQHESGAEVADVVNGGAAPACESGAPTTRRRERRPGGPGTARGRPTGLDETGLAELRERAVRERPRAGVNATDLAARRELLGYGPAVTRLFAEQAERRPLGQRGLRTRGPCQVCHLLGSQ